MNTWHDRGRKILFGVCAMTLVASVTLNVAFLHGQKPVYHALSFKEGNRVPLLTAEQVGGGVAILKFSPRMVLYVFSPRCEWCKRDYKNLLTISEAAKNNYDIIGITDIADRPFLQDYLRERPFPGRAYIVDIRALDAESAYRFRGTPQLLIVGSSGKVKRAWPGALFGDRLADAEQYFKIRLPGLTAVSGPTK